MSGLSFLRDVAGRITEILGIQTSAGVADAGKIASLDAVGRWDISMMPVGVAAEVVTCATSENLSGGNWVNLYLNAAVLTARKADATTAGKEAKGFVLVASTSPADAVVYLEGSNTGVTGATIGTEYFLNTTAGGETATAPSASGNVVQPLGVATSATVINFIPSAPGHLVVKA